MLVSSRRKFLGAIPLVIAAPAIVRAQTLMELHSGSVAKVAAASGFTGIGDIVAAQNWWGLRAYSAAKRGTQNAQGNAGGPYSTNAVTGANDDAGMTGAGMSRFTNLTDQTGNGADFAGSGTNPVYLASALGAHSTLQFTSGDARSMNSSAAIQDASQPLSINLLIIRTGDFTTGTGILAASSATFPNVGYSSSTNTVYMKDNGTTATGTASDSTWHSLTFVFNGASSKIIVDGSSSTVSTGTVGFSSANMSLGLDPNASTSFTGFIMELGVFAGDISSNATTIFNNQKTYWGF